METAQRLSTRLRLGTRTERARCATSPLFAKLHDGTVSGATLRVALATLGTIEEALGEAVQSTRDPLLTVGWSVAARHLPTARRGADHLCGVPGEMVAAPRLHALMIAEEIALRSRRDPASLVGYVYVVSGLGIAQRASSLGGALREHAGRNSGRQWASFVAALDAAHPVAGAAQSIVDAAQEAIENIERLAQAIDPGDLVSARGSALNPEAGHHAIADDPREIRAALRAGVRSWERFPYYEWRYGRRGRRFTRSDSAWLVTLAGLPQATVDRQIAWLGKLLASRGMPRWLLEQHLGLLHEELGAAVPERRDDYARLLDAARCLRRQRTAIIDEATRRALTVAFDGAVGLEWSRRLPDVGGLLATAVCDERTGVANAATNLAGWLTDPARFPALWIAAVAETLAVARSLAAPGD